MGVARINSVKLLKIACHRNCIHYWLTLDKICSYDPEYITFPNSLKIGKIFHLPI